MNVLNRVKNDQFYVLVLLILALMLVSLWCNLMNRNVFAFDDMMNLISYRSKLAEEGRWINYLAFHVVRWMNAQLILFINLVLMSIFCYRVSRNLFDQATSLLIVLFADFSLSFYYLSDSPLTSFSMFLFAAIAAITHKKMDKLLFFLLFGVIFNGVNASFYFVLPLLFLREKSNKLLIILVYWVLGYIIGFLVAELFVLARTGHLIELAEWRQSTYISDFNTLCKNAAKTSSFFVQHLSKLGIIGSLFTIASGLVHLYNYKRNIKRGLILFLVFICIIFSAYAHAFPCGIVVSPRTSWGLFLGCIFAISFSLRDRKKILYTTILIVAASFFVTDSKEVLTLNAVKKINESEFKRIEISPSQVERVVFLHDLASKSPHYMSGVPFCSVIETPISMGFKNVVVADHSYLIKYGVNIHNLIFCKKGGYHYALSNGILIIKVNHDYHYKPLEHTEG